MSDAMSTHQRLMRTSTLTTKPGQGWARALQSLLSGVVITFAGIVAAQSPVNQSPGTAVDRAGEVVFVAGSVSRQTSGGATGPVAKGDALAQGDVIAALADGYVYARMADGGLLVVRPRSSLRIDRWRFDPANPAASEIKYTLTGGVARYVSGRGSQAAKDGFRFNTPIAAIGVRGTDFTVLAENALTRVVVRSGGVVVSPLGGSCRVDALGPCDGASATELFASAREKMIQIKQGDVRPELVDTNVVPAPDRTSPPAPSEPVASRRGPAVTEAVIQDYRARQTLESYVPPAQSPQASFDPVWGRTAIEPGSAISPTNYASVVGGRSLIASNRSFVLAATMPTSMALPDSGIGDFKLNAHQGVVIDKSTSRLVDSVASNGSLRIDFDNRRFQTAFDLKANDVSARIQGLGSVGSDGTLLSAPFSSPTLIQGVVAGSEAAYLYQRSLSPTLDAAGAMSWKK
ncbi:MAG: FecR domain-containing protein [Burkholderiaceae bacterium]|nr:FecR domain-containing protein [Burkholderiaceae bacterium]